MWMCSFDQLGSFMKTCAFCLEQRIFIKAHAIPEAFFRQLRVDGESPMLISSEFGNYPKRAPIGVYDDEILCEECEPKFGQVDDYGIEVLLKRFDEVFQPLQSQGDRPGFQSTTVDPSRLLQFLVAVLWRASVSSQNFYSKVDLGPHEPLARIALTRPIGALPTVFDAVLSRWCDEDESVPTTAMLDPRREKWFGINAYRLYFGETVAYVKVDRQPFPPKLKAIFLRSAPPVLVVSRTMSVSKEFRVLKHTAQRSHANKLNSRNGRRSD